MNYYVYDRDGLFIVIAKTLAQALKAAKGYRESFIVDFADRFISGSKESYKNSIMCR